MKSNPGRSYLARYRVRTDSVGRAFTFLRRAGRAFTGLRRAGKAMSGGGEGAAVILCPSLASPACCPVVAPAAAYVSMWPSAGPSRRAVQRTRHNSGASTAASRQVRPLLQRCGTTDFSTAGWCGSSVRRVDRMVLRCAWPDFSPAGWCGSSVRRVDRVVLRCVWPDFSSTGWCGSSVWQVDRMVLRCAWPDFSAGYWVVRWVDRAALCWCAWVSWKWGGSIGVLDFIVRIR